MSAIIFKLKLSALMKFLTKRKILGEISAIVWRIEYQKRGIPHAHILLWTNFDTQDIHAVEKVINVRYPKRTPFIEDREMVSDFRKLIDSFQIHHHSKRCQRKDASDQRKQDVRNCQLKYPQPLTDHHHSKRCPQTDSSNGLTYVYTKGEFHSQQTTTDHCHSGRCQPKNTSK
jgi:hypothetical protein